ncbi:MAG: hypothetical protein OEV14_04960 [Gammaproteobacteria bacterium]|nr:hypothetical protein [Gammaproteobacteria bacterium]
MGPVRYIFPAFVAAMWVVCGLNLAYMASGLSGSSTHSHLRQSSALLPGF